MTEKLDKKKSMFSTDKKQIFTVPNILTYIRIICIPIFIVLFLNEYLIAAFIILCLASFTDIIDGKIARKYNLISDIGKALDPLADKLLQVSVIILLTVTHRIHWIFAVLIFLKELYMLVGSYVLIRKNIIGQANIWGKIAASLLFTGIVLAFLDGVFLLLASIVLSIGLVISYYAAYQYTYYASKAYKKYLEQGSENRIYLDYNNKK